MIDTNPRPDPEQDVPPDHSPALKPIWVSLKFLAAYAVAFVNAAAILYILFRLVLAGIHRFLEAI